MKKLNTKSDVYYLEKAVFFAPLQLAKAHIIDDDCNEFIVTIKKTPDTFFSRGYISPNQIIIIDYEEYTDFEFWSGAKCRAEKLTYSELEQITAILEELYPEGIDETTINDIFWFEEDTIAEWLGYNSFDEIWNRDEE